MELILPAIELKQAALDFKQEHLDYGETHIHGSGGLIQADDYEKWLERINAHITTPQPGFLPIAVFFGVVDGRIVGIIDLRLTYDLNDERLKHGGHIAATVRPSERRKGYGAKMLALALEKCRELNIDKVLITCDKNNMGSANLILKSGGVFENEIFKDDGNVTQRYWISL